MTHLCLVSGKNEVLFCLIVAQVISRDILSLSSLSDYKNKTRWCAAGTSTKVSIRSERSSECWEVS